MVAIFYILFINLDHHNLLILTAPASICYMYIYLEISPLPLPSMITFHSFRLSSFLDYPNIGPKDLSDIEKHM